MHFVFLIGRLGTLKPERFVLTMNHVRQIYDPKTLPKNFDAEQKWPNYISPIQDQGWCGSSWAISTAAVASDRYKIYTHFLDIKITFLLVIDTLLYPKVLSEFD